MRKNGLWIGLLVLLFGVLCALFLPVDLFPIEDVAADMTLDEDGNAYLVINDDAHSRIVSADREGRVLYCYTESSSVDGDASAIGPVVVSDGQIFFIRSLRHKKYAEFDRWQLVRLNMQTGETAVLYSDYTDNGDVTGLSLSDGMLYLAGIGQRSKAGEAIDTITLHRLDLERADADPLLVTSADVAADATVITVVHGGGSTACALLSNGSLVRANGSLTEETHTAAEGGLSGLYGVDGYLWACTTQQGSFLSGTASRMRVREISGTVLSGAATSTQLIMRIRTDKGEVVIARSEGDNVDLIENLQVPVAIRMQIRWPAMVVTAVVLLVVMLMAVLLLKTLSMHSLRNSLTMAVIGSSAVFFSVAVLGVGGFMLHAQNQQTTQIAFWYAQEAAATLEDCMRTVADSNGQSYERMLGLPENTDISVTYAVFQIDEYDNLVPIFLPRNGMMADAEMFRVTNEVKLRGYSITGKTASDGRSADLSAVPIRSMNEIVNIVVAMVVSAERVSLFGGMGLFLLFAVLLFVLCALALSILIQRRLRPIGPIVNQMDHLAIGDTSIDEIECDDNELGRLARSLQELAVGMAIRDHEMQMTLESCRRFVPQGMEKLLDRGTITEIACGDLTATVGPIGLIADRDADRMRARLNDREFVDYINRCFMSISASIRPKGGVLLTGGLDLNAIRVLFTEGSDKGVHALISLLGDNGASRSNCFALLHHAHFLYGIAGAEDEAFPYLASTEVSFFSGKLAKLEEAGCRLVVTDAFLETLSEHFSTRYIGFFSSNEKGRIYKLYEVLECYGELERAKREQYDARLQEAIRCFYQNDFYLARNLFLAILRLCPEDGIARWYLFACEHYFNAGAGKEANYDLFGVTH